MISVSKRRGFARASDITGFARVIPEWKDFSNILVSIRENSKTPEFINDGVNSHPSARLKNILLPKYNKAIHGPQISAEMGITCMRSECHHFDNWLSHIENLPVLDKQKV
ncbi:MAG: DUF4276 family protein [Rhodothermaceae bacterium]|nr:DUF4276 family protein [Rhodothermaceae bacterium]MYE63344.1 DUF4276 family protein [Rhodothermaceae bacterium]MYJ21193.1 DUF4276 family protein [Rhodothermaceae bacterium]